MALCSLADVKAWLSTGTQPIGSRDDALLFGLISRTSDFIESWLARPIGLANWQEIRDGAGGEHGDRMELAVHPVVAVLSLMIRGWGWSAPQQMVPIDPWQPGSLNQAGYFVDDSAVVLQGYRFPRGRSNVRIQYTAGYNPIPGDIQQACIKMVATQYKERTRIGVKTVNIGGVETVSYDTSMFGAREMSDIEAILWQYRQAFPVKRATLLPPPPPAVQLEDTSTIIELEDGTTPIIGEPG
jgi:hypothetical protein